MTNRSVPADIQAERDVLGSILLEREAILAVSDILQADDFYLEKHALIFQAMLACLAERVPPRHQHGRNPASTPSAVRPRGGDVVLSGSARRGAHGGACGLLRAGRHRHLPVWILNIGRKSICDKILKPLHLAFRKCQYIPFQEGMTYFGISTSMDKFKLLETLLIIHRG